MDKRWGAGRWRPLIRFATWQFTAAKWRVIDNGRSASHNWSLAADERIHTTSVRAGGAIARRLRRYAGRRLGGPLEPRSATQDMKRAFRQLGVRDVDRAYHIIAAWSPVDKCWMFAELDGLAFGLGAAVLEFNRVPALVCAIARRWLGIPVVNFYDDFRISDIAAGDGSANESFLELMDWLGPLLDEDKEQKPAAGIVFLGALEDSARVSTDDAVYLRALEKRRIALLAALRKAINRQCLMPADAASLVGKLIHIGDTLQGRIGRATLAGLAMHSRGDSTVMDVSALRSAAFYEYLLRGPISQSIPLDPGAYPVKAIITDASWADTGVPGLLGRIAFVIMDPDPRQRVGGVFNVASDSEILAELEVRRTQIMPCEALGPIIALYLARHRLAHRALNCFIDNISGLCALAKGASRRPDLSALCYAFHLAANLLDAKPWVDYVQTSSNLADGGSRVGILDDLSRTMGIRFVEVPFFKLPKDFVNVKPEVWHAWWHDGARWADEFERQVSTA